MVSTLMLQTPRLRLFRMSETSESDCAFMLRMLNDADFLRFIGDRGVRTLSQASDYLRDGAVASYHANGFGMLRVERKDSGESIGLCGLVWRQPLPHPDLGYALLPEFRGCGYSREAAAGVLAFAGEALGLRTILAIVDPDNAASLRLLEGLRFGFEKKVRLSDDDIELKLFALKTDRQVQNA